MANVTALVVPRCLSNIGLGSTCIEDFAFGHPMSLVAFGSI